MGQTLQAWIDRVENIVKDTASVDVSDVQAVGVDPAIALYSIDRPRTVVVEAAGDGTAYLDLPSTGDGWVTGFSRVERIEYPARDNPPRYLDRQAWQLTRSTADVTVEQIVLLEETPSSSEYVRIEFTTAWPTPTATASVDQIDSVGFHAVTHLAASFCLHHIANEAARSRGGALPTQFVDGTNRARELRDQAKELRAVYDAYLGRTAGGGDSGGSNRPVSRTFDFDPAYHTVFHGRRR